MTFPVSEKVTPQVTPQVKRPLNVIILEHGRQELQELLGLTDRENFRKNYLQPALDAELIEMTIPDKLKSSKQKYRLTEKES
ncbi:Fic family protein [Snuella lapsa]|uniref:Filamentation induced by cAMP protein Fic-like C-terminal domain-containing protein n=1 Tax=Snuella lapsa TaxID=870481 RepID=A0ABP6WYP6_9FLAO